MMGCANRIVALIVYMEDLITYMLPLHNIRIDHFNAPGILKSQ